MLYVVHDEAGEIQQANKLFADDQLVNSAGKKVAYDDLLHERGLKFIKDAKAQHHATREHWMVDTSVGRLKERTVMGVVYVPTIKAGSTAVISNIPIGAAVTISALDTVLYSVPIMPGTDIDWTTESVPCTYTVMIRLRTYKDCVIKIQAVGK